MLNAIESAVSSFFISAFGSPLVLSLFLILTIFVIASAIGVPPEVMVFIMVPAGLFMFVHFSDVNVKVMWIVVGFIVAITIVGTALTKLMRR